MSSDGSLNSSVVSVGIRPKVSMLSVLSHLNYKAWFAVAEFVDNSIQSYFTNRESLRQLHGDNFVLRVDIRLDQENKRIEIRDNAFGIKGVDFPRAFRPAETPSDRNGLSEFGMGMKTAACWFTNTWHVRTKALGETVERNVRFNIDQIIAADLNDLEVEEKPSQSQAHYTVLRLENLGKKFPQTKTQKKLRDHLASIYRIYLRTGEIQIYFGDDSFPLNYTDPETLVAPPFNAPNSLPLEWRKEVYLELSGDRKISGFAALRKEASTSLAGFALFRRNRLIEGSDDETYRPVEIFGNTNSFRYQRLYGELHIEGFDVSHTKDGFRWDELEEEFLEKLKFTLQEEPINLLRQAEQHRARPSKAALQPILQKATDSLSEDIVKTGGAVLSDDNYPPAENNFQEELVPGLIASSRTFALLVDEQQWNITVRSTVDPAITDWISVVKVERLQLLNEFANEITIDVSMAHPFVQEFIGSRNENTDLFLRIAVAISLASEKSGRAGYPTALMINWFNCLLRDSLSRSSE